MRMNVDVNRFTKELVDFVVNLVKGLAIVTTTCFAGKGWCQLMTKLITGSYHNNGD